MEIKKYLIENDREFVEIDNVLYIGYELSSDNELTLTDTYDIIIISSDKCEFNQKIVFGTSVCLINYSQISNIEFKRRLYLLSDLDTDIIIDKSCVIDGYVYYKGYSNVHFSGDIKSDKGTFVSKDVDKYIIETDNDNISYYNLNDMSLIDTIKIGDIGVFEMLETYLDK